MPSVRRMLACLCATAATVVAVPACSGGGSKQADPHTLIDQAKVTLDATPGLHFTLSSEHTPTKGTVLVGGKGDVARPSGFQGTLQVARSGLLLNVDVVSSDGEYLGGAIAPGVQISMDALTQRAARLVKVEIEDPGGAIGHNTQAAIRSGIVYGFAGQVDGIVGRIREELGVEALTIATGGLASTFAPFCEEIDEVDDLLTLAGLRIVWNRNRES